MSGDSGLPAGREPESNLDLTLAEFQRKLADPAVTVADALSGDQYATGHIPGSISLPLDDVADRASEVLPSTSGEVVFYCGGPT